MSFLLALRNLTHTPRRTLLVMAGFALGVGAMIALLSTGEAIARQAEDKSLLSGGDFILLPAGIDVEVLRTGGATGMFFSIHNARHLYRALRQRLGGKSVAISPVLKDEVLYLRHRGKVHRVLASGALSDEERALGNREPMWRSTAEDEAWGKP